MGENKPDLQQKKDKLDELNQRLADLKALKDAQTTQKKSEEEKPLNLNPENSINPRDELKKIQEKISSVEKELYEKKLELSETNVFNIIKIKKIENKIKKLETKRVDMERKEMYLSTELREDKTEIFDNPEPEKTKTNEPIQFDSENKTGEIKSEIKPSAEQILKDNEEMNKKSEAERQRAAALLEEIQKEIAKKTEDEKNKEVGKIAQILGSEQAQTYYKNKEEKPTEKEILIQKSTEEKPEKIFKEKIDTKKVKETNNPKQAEKLPEEFSTSFIEEKTKDFLESLKKTGEIKEIKGSPRAHGIDDEITLITEISASGFLSDIDINIKIVLENKENSISIKNHEIYASGHQKRVEEKLVPKLDKIPGLLRSYVEKERGKEVEKIWIENGKLKVLFREKSEINKIMETETKPIKIRIQDPKIIQEEKIEEPIIAKTEQKKDREIEETKKINIVQELKEKIEKSMGTTDSGKQQERINEILKKLKLNQEERERIKEEREKLIKKLSSLEKS